MKAWWLPDLAAAAFERSMSKYTTSFPARSAIEERTGEAVEKLRTLGKYPVPAFPGKDSL
ncbi:MAG: hypothetical protein JO280_00795 [Mycobacteriaceae bacterium]|nr:hypothetical protein [Mycobacteriaceae bacterium]